MGKLLVGDLKDIKRNLKDGLVCSIGDEHSFELRTYLPITDKIALAQSIHTAVEGGASEFGVADYNIMDIMFKVYIVKGYTNISLPKNIIEAYDLVIELGIYDIIIDKIPKEVDMCKEVLSNHILEQEKIYDRKNSVGNVFKDFLDKLYIGLEALMDKIPSQDGINDMVESIGEQLEDLDVDKLNFVKDFVEKDKGEKDEERDDV